MSCFAPSERVPAAEIDTAAKLFESDELVAKMTDAIPNPIVILNDCRQTVYANKNMLAMIGTDSLNAIKGKRPGEIINCVHADNTCGGCGTSEFCRECGAVNAILESQLENRQSVRECRVLTKDNSAFTVAVWATPFEYAGTDFTIFALADISGEKRRASIERTLFHDILNTIGGISGLANLLLETDDVVEVKELAQTIYQASDEIIENIRSHRQLAAAEHKVLELTESEQDVLSLLKEVVSLYRGHDLARGKNIVINDFVEGIKIITDAALAKRVLGNMIKNAIEATPKGGTVTVSLRYQKGEVEFSVHNASVIPKDIQLQMFQRSFSTKASDRGIGTYSMKLLGENYLRGKVWFESSDRAGTVFYFKLPQLNT